jgi:tetratricopeptide (TPR) repeat protein
MKKNLQLQKKLREILLSQDDQKLEFFEDAKVWEDLSMEEREQLALLFIKRGEKQLNNKEAEGINSLNLVEQLAPHSHHIFYQKGKVLSSQQMNVPCLNAACSAFKHALSLRTDDFDAIHRWGMTLTYLGKIQGENAYLYEAAQKFEDAHRLITDNDVLSKGEFFWNWAQCWYYQGKLSGEADDFRHSLTHYREAEKCGIDSPEFWNDFGESMTEFAFLLGRKEYLFDSIKYFLKAVNLSSKFYPSMLNLACALGYAFEIDGDHEYFKLSHEAFEKAAELENHDVILWLKWGHLHLANAKIFRELDRLQTCFEKFALADACDGDNPFVLMRWAEAQVLFGGQQERVDMLRSAEQKITRSLKHIPDNPESWYIYGICLNELGRYFQDDEFYYQAIEKFRYGLSLNQADPVLWYGLALAHFAIGELNDDVHMVEKSSQYCAKVFELEGHSLPHFWNDWGVALMKLAEMKNDKISLEKAIEKFELAIGASQPHEGEEDSADPECLYNYGCALDFMGDFTEDAHYYEHAVAMLERALEIDPAYNNARYNLALALSHLGEANADVEILQKSIEHFQILLTSDPEDEMGWNDWGLALLHLALLLHDPIHVHQGHALFEQAEEKLLHAVALGCTQSFYNLACLHSLRSNYSTAIHFMERSVQAECFPSIDDILHDEWLEGLRNTSIFRHFLNQISSKEQET